MIIDSLEHIEFYAPLLPHLKEGLEAIRKVEAEGPLKEGKYDFEGGFFKVQIGHTTPFTEGTFEGHEKYIDVPILVDGSEEIAWQEIKDLTEAIPYDAEKDAARYTGTFEHQIMVSKGMFWAAFPQDGHKAISHSKEQQNFTKIILKLPVKG